MKSQPNRNYISNDDIMTPQSLAEQIVKHFAPEGEILEPCKGEGSFLAFLPPDTKWCEIKEGKDFFSYNEYADWIITNPPWSQMKNFLLHSMDISWNVVFLMTLNHLWTKARLRDMLLQEHSIKEIILVDTPESFPQSGFQLGIVHLQKYYCGSITFTDWRDKPDE